MPSPTDVAKRELVRLLKSLAAKYGVQLEVTRDSSNKEVVKAWRKVSLKTHLDNGGEAEESNREVLVMVTTRDLQARPRRLQEQVPATDESTVHRTRATSPGDAKRSN